MRELALHILDIAENALQAGASLLRLEVCADAKTKLLRFGLYDNGTGMSDHALVHACSPFFSSRTSRRFGLGLALLEQSVSTAGGELSVRSAPEQGTQVIAQYPLMDVGRPPMGDLSGTLFLLLTTSIACEFVVVSVLQDGLSRILDTRSLKAAVTPPDAVRTQLDEMFPAGFADPWLDAAFLSLERRAVRKTRQCAAQTEDHADCTRK